MVHRTLKPSSLTMCFMQIQKTKWTGLKLNLSLLSTAKKMVCLIDCLSKPYTTFIFVNDFFVLSAVKIWCWIDIKQKRTKHGRRKQETWIYLLPPNGSHFCLDLILLSRDIEWSGGFKGVGTRNACPISLNSFIFIQFWAKQWQNNRFLSQTQELVPPQGNSESAPEMLHKMCTIDPSRPYLITSVA